MTATNHGVHASWVSSWARRPWPDERPEFPVIFPAPRFPDPPAEAVDLFMDRRDNTLAPADFPTADEADLLRSACFDPRIKR